MKNRRIVFSLMSKNNFKLVLFIATFEILSCIFSKKLLYN